MSKIPYKSVLIIGCGYVGRRVAALEIKAGREVHALTRSEIHAGELRKVGIHPFTGDLDEKINIPLAADIVYYFLPPPSRGRQDPRMENFIASLEGRPLPRRIVLLSTTGLYGDCQGEWVTEGRRPEPAADRAFRRLHAETVLAAFAHKKGIETVVLRVAGIYGPGRLPVSRLKEGEPVLRESESPFSNRIHADDLAAVCLAAAERGLNCEVYNVSDGHPSTMTDYFFRVADLLHIPRPPEISLEEAKRVLGEGILSYLAESKRIDNSKMLRELGIVLKYPDLASGLPSCI